MSVRIRLARAGAKKSPYYHVIATDARNSRDGKFLEQIGSYDPRKQPAKFEIDMDRLAYWVKAGAQQSETVEALVKRFKKQQATTAA